MPIIHIGNGAYVDSGQVSVVVRFNKDSRIIRTILNDAKAQKTYYRMTGAKKLASFIVMKNGFVIGSCVSAKTLARCMNENQSVTDATKLARHRGIDHIGQAEDTDDAYLDDSYESVDEIEADEDEFDDDEVENGDTTEETDDDNLDDTDED